jgi:hypothetical protein
MVDVFVLLQLPNAGASKQQERMQAFSEILMIKRKPSYGFSVWNRPLDVRNESDMRASAGQHRKSFFSSPSRHKRTNRG